MDVLDVVQAIRDLAVAAAAIVGALLAWRRLGPSAVAATAAERSAGAADDQAALARRAYVTEQLRMAVADLRADRLEVRLAAIHILREIARGFPELATPVFEVLQSYLRDMERSESGDIRLDAQAIAETLKLRIRTDDGT